MTYHARATKLAAQFEPTEERAQFAADVVAGLSASPKHISPKYFYDTEGSQLFEQITHLPQYYPTRSEHEILREHGKSIVQHFPTGSALVEFGSGACIKVRFLLNAADKLKAYVPVDIAGEFLAIEAATLRKDYPRLQILPVAADFMQPFVLPKDAADLPRVGFFPGSTIGNLDPHEAVAFLRHAGAVLGRGSVMIVGVDLVKDADVLNAAYNDAAGITAKFNINLLRRMNRELGGHFELETFEHHAFYDRDKSRIEMHLASRKRQTVKVAGGSFDFRAGETIHTENSCKYTPDSFRSLVKGAGWTPVDMWTDRAGLFSVHALVLK